MKQTDSNIPNTCKPLSEIDTSEIHRIFNIFLKKPNNRRIIVSGIFGIGKTTFLRKFFHDNKGEYFHIHLFPVNYSVAANDDIFELIKYDILYELLRDRSSIESIRTRWFDVIGFLDKGDIYHILTPFVALIPKLGKSISDLAEAIENLIKIYKERKGKLEKTELHKVIELVNQTENTKGNIYENDFYTQLITQLINSIQKNGRKVVITIDDIDRIDPDHIFRILNIFAAHFDRDQSSNKFDIDAVITCCDINNIRRIFHNRYGSNVDFSGYIDKFYSREIFLYNSNSDEISTTLISRIIESFKFGSFSKAPQFLPDDIYFDFLANTIKELVLSGNMNLRSLYKYTNHEYNYPRRKIKTSTIDTYWNWQFPLFTTIAFLSSMMGGLDNLEIAIDRSNFFVETNKPSTSRILGDMMLVNKLAEMDFSKISEQNPYWCHGEWGKTTFKIHAPTVGNKKLDTITAEIVVSAFDQSKLPAKEFHKRIFLKAIRVYALYIDY